MATLTATSTANSNGFDMTNIPFFVGDPKWSWFLPSNIHISNDFHQQDYYGDFNFDKNGNASGNITATYYSGSGFYNITYPDYSITNILIDAKTAFDFIERREISSLFKTVFAGDDLIIGTTKGDFLTGFNGNDTIIGQIGDDIIDGGEGGDTVQFGGIFAQTTLTRTPTGWLAHGPNSSDTLINIENVRFDNVTITPRFNALKYVASHPDLIKTFGIDELAAETHYLQIGFYEGRTASFDALKYIASYPDLILSFGTDERAAEIHYIQNGFFENREATFDALKYIASYPDLITTFGINELAAESHYIHSGYYEGRSATFDALKYIAANPDLLAAFGTNEKAAQIHYIQNVFFEKREIFPSGPNALNHSSAQLFPKNNLEFIHDNNFDYVNKINVIGVSSAINLETS
ncbi:MAG: hypothetical protein DYH15_05255 [Nitrosomonas sp. PRO4]|nr:hypothetical protein [Nitrosomonas sp. PRO4]